MERTTVNVMHRLIIIISFLLLGNLLIAQDDIVLQLNPSFHEQSLILNDEYNLNGERIKIETLKFYLSNILLLNKTKEVWHEENNHHLVDASNSGSLSISFNLPSLIQFDSIHFSLGIDSLTNVSGAIGGDLDPTKGMYWTWQSGYINFKLEGSSPVCNTRNNLFQFHLGGYLPPFASVQSVRLKVVKADTIVIGINVADFLEKVDLSSSNSIMSPGQEAQKLSRLVSSIFYCDEE